MRLRKGMIVNYHPTPTECGKMREHRSTCNISEELPAMVVAVCGEEMVNLKVMLDGVGDQWATSVHKGDGVGEWNFYPEEAIEVSADLGFRGGDLTGTIRAEQMATKEELAEVAFPELADMAAAEIPEEGTKTEAPEEVKKEVLIPKAAKGGKKV